MLFGTRENFDYFQCSSCQCLQISTPPENLDAYYPENYYSFHREVLPQPRSWKRYLKRKRTQYFLGDTSLIGKILTVIHGEPLLDAWAKNARLRIDSHILDVGCGNGHLLSRLANEGFTRLTGIDPFFTREVNTPCGFQTHKRTIEEESDCFDFVMLHHTFEHVTNPEATLRAIHKATKPDGRVLIRIPVISWAWEHYGVHWVGIDAPRHFWIHSLKSMELLCESCGFAVESIQYDSTGFQFWGSEQYMKNIPLENELSAWTGRSQIIFSERQMQTWEQAAQSLNEEKRGDQACFFLIKK